MYYNYINIFKWKTQKWSLSICRKCFQSYWFN